MWLKVWIKLYIDSWSVCAGQKLQFHKIMKVKWPTFHIFWVTFWEERLLAQALGEGRSNLKQVQGTCWPLLPGSLTRYPCLTQRFIFLEKPQLVRVKTTFHSMSYKVTWVFQVDPTEELFFFLMNFIFSFSFRKGLQRTMGVKSQLEQTNKQTNWVFWFTLAN